MDLADAFLRTGNYDAIEAELTAAAESADAATRADALDKLGVVRHYRTIELPRPERAAVDHRPEQDLFERALAVRRQLGDRAGVAESLLHLGWVHQVLRPPDPASGGPAGDGAPCSRATRRSAHGVAQPREMQNVAVPRVHGMQNPAVSARWRRPGCRK